MKSRLLIVSIKAELDVVASRQRARQIASLCGFGAQDQARIATAVSELARNVFNYALHGQVEFFIEGDTAPQALQIRIQDNGPGIADLDLIHSGRYQSATGLGLGILGARRMMDQCDIQTDPSKGTCIVIKKFLPKGAPLLTPHQVGNLGSQLAPLPLDVTFSEVQQQNQELLSTLADLQARQEELLQLTRELEDTNRGVVALYAELDESAGDLRRSDEMKSRFLLNMTHEFRTPLNSIQALTDLLLNRSDGELTAEQEKQVTFIRQGALSLSELVNDLLDMAKIEAGKIDVLPDTFEVRDMFSALRGMLRPLLSTHLVKLEFDDVSSLGAMYNDEAKISQILRNFISNALKFTDSGEVRVSAVSLPDQAAIKFSVKDTGLGVAPQNQQLIFEEFSQIANRLQHGTKGTGLGLPLCSKLATLLGGHVGVESIPDQGSTFWVVIPRCYSQPEGSGMASQSATNDGRLPVLVVEDSQKSRRLYEEFLRDSEFFVIPAGSIREADAQWAVQKPAAVILDIMLTDENTWDWLANSKKDAHRCDVPIIVATSADETDKGMALGADAYFIKPLLHDQLIATLRQLTRQAQ